MFTFIFVAIGITLLMFFAWVGWWWGGRYAKHFAVAQSFLGVAALIAGTAWYFVARPDAPKLKLEHKLEGFPLPENQVLVLIELSISNVGGSAMKLRTPYQIYIQQITPLPAAVIDELQHTYEPDKGLHIHNADTWASIASVKSNMSTIIESSETENLYFRSVIPCDKNLRVSVASWVEKPPSFLSRLYYRIHEHPALKENLERFVPAPKRLAWIRQSTLDLTAQCDSRRATT